MLTEKDYCDYDTCVALKELDFNSLVDWYFNEDKRIVSSLARYRNTYIPRISLYEAQKWLREEKRICVEITCCASGYVWELCKAYHKDWFSGGTTIYDNAIDAMLKDCSRYESYEETLLEGIKGFFQRLFNKLNLN